MKLAIIGYGKMGKAIEEIALQKGHEIVLRISSKNIGELTTANLQSADVAIEFTNANSAAMNIELCFDANVPVVCGSTGWLKNFDAVKNDCLKKNSAFLYAGNFSIGVNIFFRINTYLAKLMSSQNEYDVTIEEIHHTQKKDAPSGTAIALAEQILKNNSFKKKWVNNDTEEIENLKIISKRIDPAAGTHSVKYHSEIDDIEIVHTANNRKGFATGAILAAEFLKDKKGFFEMKDVLEKLLNFS